MGLRDLAERSVVRAACRLRGVMVSVLLQERLGELALPVDDAAAVRFEEPELSRVGAAQRLPLVHEVGEDLAGPRDPRLSHGRRRHTTARTAAKYAASVAPPAIASDRPG